MTSVRFRQARLSDAQGLWWTKRVAIERIESGEYTDEQLEAWRPDGEAIADFERAIESDTFTILVAEGEEGIVGYGVLNVDEERIDALFVHPDSTGDGIATSLVKQLETRAQLHHIQTLTIVSSLNAMSFYESLGYVERERKTRAIDGVHMEFVVTQKTL